MTLTRDPTRQDASEETPPPAEKARRPVWAIYLVLYLLSWLGADAPLVYWRPIYQFIWDTFNNPQAATLNFGSRTAVIVLTTAAAVITAVEFPIAHERFLRREPFVIACFEAFGMGALVAWAFLGALFLHHLAMGLPASLPWLRGPS